MKTSRKNLFKTTKMKNKHLSLSNVYKDLNDACIVITPSSTVSLNSYSKILLYRFMSLLNSLIGAQTNINYHIERVQNFTIVIPIYPYSNIEKQITPYDLIEKRVTTVRTYLEHINWEKVASKTDQWVIGALATHGINISTDFVISTISPNEIGFPNLNEDPLNINGFNHIKPTFKRVELNDGSIINYLSSPYLIDYAVYANLSVTFDEMGMSYNALHLYEHLMTKGWSDLDNTDLTLMNGGTWPVGLCSIFAISKKLDTLKLYAANFIKYYLESRDEGFWDKPKNRKNIELETMRTLSETRLERSMTSLARSDVHAYDFNYNTQIFQYWSNKPFNVLIAGPDGINTLKLNHETINAFIGEHPIRQIQRPKNIVVHSLPFETLRTKKLQGYHILKADPKLIHDELLKSTDTSTRWLYGVDAKIVSNVEDLSTYNTIIHPLVFMSNKYTEDELRTFVETNVIPYSCCFFDSCSLKPKYAGKYLITPEDENNPEICGLVADSLNMSDDEDDNDGDDRKSKRRKGGSK